jgi:hypothetical protein
MSTYAARPARQQRPEGWENFLFIAVLALLGIGAVLWATGEISGYLSSGHWPGASLSHMGRALVRLGQDPGDPAAAWPRSSRQSMSSPVLFYAILCAFVVVGTAGGVVVWRAVQRLFAEPGASSGSKWASLADLRALIVKAPMPARLTLGRVRSKLIAGEERQSVIVLGPTQSMKTTGFAIPSILE